MSDQRWNYMNPVRMLNRRWDHVDPWSNTIYQLISTLPRKLYLILFFYTMYNFNLSVHLGSLTNAVGAMYAKEYFPESAKKVADDMVNNVK